MCIQSGRHHLCTATRARRARCCGFAIRVSIVRRLSMGRSMPNIDTGNTGFMLLCSSLVMLMTPGLAFFYGGLVSRRNVLTIMMQSFASMGWTTVIWFAFGYSLCFSGGAGGIIGNFDMAFL